MRITHARLFFILSLVLFMVLSVVSAAQGESSRFNTSKRYLYVQPGQTLAGIVSVLYPDDQAHWQAIAKKIVLTNPHAFENGKISRIIVGSRIELPSYQGTYAATKTASAPAPVGSVVAARGIAYAIHTDKKRRDIKTGSEIYVGDHLYTGADGLISMKMIDDAKIDLRCNSELLIENYKMVPHDNTSIIHLLKGSLHKVTGKIGKNIADRYEMRTPVATVGVRGTEYVLRVLQSRGCDGSVDVNTDAMLVQVDKGGIDVSNTTGDTSLETGHALLIANKTTKPKRVVVNPGVFTEVKPKPTSQPYIPAVQPPETAPVPAEEKGHSWWWILLGVLIIAAA